ncbi:GntR family transcriptional regulator [Umezawaea endophytica]|uniref:GntR family transcriptional regulator n=1 Tax=Umezawaea endophytica TaxID=1654476 RepID=A0A9X3A0D4_9PSEU|nr:GntR family transcriptional regulator [Umezawaea endophytica]MCS7478424.1 GntR family transcriptional regulator [Umezawaea endophytica]
MTESLRDQVYARLQDEILSGHLAVTERFTEPRLAKQLGVSRTPVREALTRLMADGLVRREDYGYSIVVPDMPKIRDLYEVRIAVELRGIARSIENPSVRHSAEALEAELEHWYGLRSTPPSPRPEFVLEDERFHAALLGAGGNPELVDALIAVNRRIRNVRMYDFIVEGRIETSIAEHIEIMERVHEGQLDKALILLHEHIGASLEIVVERATRALAARHSTRIV